MRLVISLIVAVLVGGETDLQLSWVSENHCQDCVDGKPTLEQAFECAESWLYNQNCRVLVEVTATLTGDAICETVPQFSTTDLTALVVDGVPPFWTQLIVATYTTPNSCVPTFGYFESSKTSDVCDIGTNEWKFPGVALTVNPEDRTVTVTDTNYVIDKSPMNLLLSPDSADCYPILTKVVLKASAGALGITGATSALAAGGALLLLASLASTSW